MRLKISNKPFYSRHLLEIQKYQKNEDVLHLVNHKSKDKFKDLDSEILYVDSSFESLNNSITNQLKYSTILLTDIVEDVDDIYNFLKSIKSKLLTNGKVIISSTNTHWRVPSKILEVLKLKDKTNKNSYIHLEKIKNVADGIGLEYLRSTSRQYFPFKFLGVGTLINVFFEIIFFKFNLGIRTYTVLRNIEDTSHSLSKCIIIPAKNEEGNLEELFNRIPNKEEYEIIFSIGKSQDRTYEVAEKIKNNNPNCNVKLINQTKTGKANAVWESLDISTSEIIAILDADISVDPETMPFFFEIIQSNKADFVNGTRLIYEMEKGSMRFINKIGNRFFQFIIGNVINVKLTDSLCGTKVFRRSLIEKIYWWQTNFKMKDPFGDFDLIFTAAYTGSKIIEYPIHYRTRKYGKTQISRFKDGFKLIIYIVKSFLAFNLSRNK